MYCRCHSWAPHWLGWGHFPRLLSEERNGGDFSVFLASGLLVSTGGIRGRCPRTHGSTHIPLLDLHDTTHIFLASSGSFCTPLAFLSLSVPLSLSAQCPQGPAEVIAVFLISNGSNNTVLRFRGWGASLLNAVREFAVFPPSSFPCLVPHGTVIPSVLSHGWHSGTPRSFCVITECSIGTQWAYLFPVDDLADCL